MKRCGTLGGMLLGIVIVIAACKGDANDSSDASAILKKPPYASVTDSIADAKGAAQATLYERRADLLSRNNLHELAAADFRKAWEIRPDEATALRYAATLNIISRPAQAIRLLEECRKKFPGNLSFANMLGDLYQQSGKPQEALQIYDDMLHIDSADFEAWYEKGLLLEKAHDTAAALDALRKAFALQPINTYGLELAHLYAETRNKAALPICDGILAKDSAHELLDPLFIKGIYFANMGQNREAITQFDSCIRRDWKFTDAHLEKGIVLFHEKKYKDASDAFLMTVKVSNTYPDGYFWLGRSFEEMGQKDMALAYYQQALSLDKDFTEARDAIKRLK